MDSEPDSALIISPNINSVLKPPKLRVPLKDLMAAVPEEDNTASRKRRVSFANVNKIKEFSAGAESMVVCQTPAYEEPFSVSSDSSYPSGVDGWTPAKGHGKPPIYPEKENLSIQSLRMSTGMDLTSIVGNSVRNTRYSVNGMDLTEVANSHESYIDHQTRFSSGMDLTNVVGHQSQNTRYSVSGMDLTSMTHSNQVLVDRRTRFSMGMDLTNVAGHSTQSTRYSINGMDLTEVVNPHQRSARFSIGMDMTNIVSNPVNTMRYSSNEVDLIETANPYHHNMQSCEGRFSANVSMDDSDGLDLTEAVDGIQFSAPSPKCKINNVGLAENVLYSVSNTRYSVNSMDMTSAAGSRLSSARRKSSRYSLLNMDLTQAINNSCDDLEFTQAIGDPRIKTDSTRNSVCGMDLTESVVVEGVTTLSLDNMNHTGVVCDQLEYSADTESIMNLTKNMPNKLDPPVYDKENILPKQSLKVIGAPTMLSCEDAMDVNSKLGNMSFCTTAYEPLSEVTPQHVISNGNELNHLQNTVPSNNSQSINHETCGLLPNESLYNILTARDAFKENLPSVGNGLRVTKQDSKGSSDNEEFHTVKNNNESICLPPTQKERVEKKIIRNKTSCVSETFSVGHLSNEINRNENLFSLNTPNCNITEQRHVDAVNKSLNLDDHSSVKELKLNTTGLHVNNFEHDSSRKEDTTTRYNFFTTYKEDLTFKIDSKTKEPISEQHILNEDAMDVSITDNSGLEEHKFNVTNETHSSEIVNPEKSCKNPEGKYSLNESVMNMSIGNCSMSKEVEVVSNIDEKITNYDGFEKYVPDPVTDCQVNHQTIDTLNFIQKENNQSAFENITPKDQSIELNVSTNTSLNLSSRSILSNKNITMTRGRSKSLIITPDSSLEGSSRSEGNKATTRTQTTTVNIETHLNDGGSNKSENQLQCEISALRSEASFEKRGKRSFEEALKPENDTEESPIKQMCLSREEPSTEFEILSDVTAPSFLMDKIAASNDTLPCLDQLETTATVHQFKLKPTSPLERNMSFTTASESTCEIKQEFSLRMDDSRIRNMSEIPLCNEVIDLCESSFDATSTEVRELINNSRYKTRNVCDDEILTKQNERFDSLKKQIDSTGLNDPLFNYRQFDQIPQTSLIKELCSNNSLNMDDTVGSNVLERDVESMCTEPLPPLHPLKSYSRRKREKFRTLGNNSYAADFIPNFVEIQFSVDSFGYVNSVNYLSIYTGDDTDIGHYLLNQARNYVLPDKGSDLILQLKSANKSFLACLARSINIICKYHNGSIKGDILTLEVASCRNHFWTFISVYIKHPQYIKQTDITISKQKIGELKLSHVRKVFNSIEKNQDQLLKFAKALTELQYNN